MIAAFSRLRGLAALATAGSAAVLLAALGFQFIGGLAPCPLCIWQRWPHVAAIVLGLAALALPARAARVTMALGAVAMLTGAGLGLFHAGVERRWWTGPTTCTSGAIDGLSVDALVARIKAAPLVRCDEIPWEFAGLSMAGWNAALSLVLAGVFAAAYASSSASQYR
jgi:disulfide bond formation protein DsbB